VTSHDITGLAGVLLWTSKNRHEAMAVFYRDVLGLTPRSDRPGFINFEWGGTRLTISTHSDVDGSAADPLRIMVNLEVTDIAATASRLSAAGVSFSRQPSEEPWGGWIATFEDPDGNTIQLMQLN
jgi:predicted enzyme related to lactoylglutathione lyase